MDSLQQKIGPLAAWEWGAVAGGAILLLRMARSGHQTTGVQTVTLTPNNQPNLPSSSGQDTVGSLISAINTLGVNPGSFSFTLPDGTTVTFTSDGIKTIPPPSTPSSPGQPPGTIFLPPDVINIPTLNGTPARPTFPFHPQPLPPINGTPARPTAPYKPQPPNTPSPVPNPRPPPDPYPVTIIPAPRAFPFLS